MKPNKITIFSISALVLLLVGAVLALAGFNLHIPNLGWLNPKGVVAIEQKSLLIKATLVMFVITLPAMFLTYFFAFKYREKNNQDYEPNKKGNNLLVAAIWSGPVIIIFIITIFLWHSVHKLDPFKQVESKNNPMKIQVIALQYKWLFIYPKENIATVNYVEFPVNTPVEFELTADAPMNSFWIPQLGGQMYAMTGMTNRLNLIANNTGEYQGSTAEMSGSGFADMRFLAKAVSDSEFDEWIKSVRSSKDMLMKNEYAELAKPGTLSSPLLYNMVDQKLYDTIIMKYMMPEK